MSSVELYRTLGDEVGLETGWHEVGSLRLASSAERMEELTRQAGWAKTFGLPLELISADEAQRLFPPMTTDGVLGAAYLPSDGYIDPSQLTFALAEGARRGGAEINTNTRVTAIDVVARPRARRRDRPRLDPDRSRRQCGRHVRGGDRPARRRDRAGDPLRARVPRHRARRPAARLADDARPLAARLLPRRVRRADHGRLRAPSRSLGPRRHPRRLQRPAARGGLGPLRGADGERDRARADARRRGRRSARERPRGVHAGRRVHPRPDRGARLLDGGRFLRARPRGRRRHGQARRRVDRRGHPGPRRLGDGLAPLRPPLREPRVHARALVRGLRDLLRREVPGPRARGRAAAARLAGVWAAAGARRRLRREVRLGAGELVRAERRRRGRVAAATRLGGTALVARDRRRAPRDARDGGALRRDVVREDGDPRRGRRRVPRAAVRQPCRARASARSRTRRC